MQSPSSPYIGKLTVFQVKVIVWSKDVGWNDRGEVAAILILVQPVLYIYHALGISIAL
jgi:hypothetical protein